MFILPTISLLAILASIRGIIFHTDPSRCEMSYMYPSYHLIHAKNPYQLLVYRDGNPIYVNDPRINTNKVSFSNLASWYSSLVSSWKCW